MTEDRVPTTEPRTAAGRRLLSGPNMRRAYLSDILAIEAEAAQGAAPLDVERLVDRIRQRIAQRTNVAEWGRDALIEYGVVMDILDEVARDD